MRKRWGDAVIAQKALAAARLLVSLCGAPRGTALPGSEGQKRRSSRLSLQGLITLTNAGSALLVPGWQPSGTCLIPPQDSGGGTCLVAASKTSH